MYNEMVSVMEEKYNLRADKNEWYAILSTNVANHLNAANVFTLRVEAFLWVFDARFLEITKQIADVFNHAFEPDVEKALPPDMLLMLGQCGDEEKIRLERFAVNMMDSTNGDNDTRCPNEETIYRDAPLAYRTPFSVRTLTETLANDNLPVRASNSAGLYVCNRVYFEALHLGQKALFVHIPKTLDATTAIQTIEQLIIIIQ